MKRKQIAVSLALGIGLMGLSFWIGHATAAGVEPGSDADPLVSKSYVDQVVVNLAEKGYVDQLVTKLAEKGYVDQMVATLAQKGYVDQQVAALAPKTYVDSRTTFQVVNLPKGSTLIGEAGTELVLRGGQVTAVVTWKGGLLDSTGGTDLIQGELVKPQHMLVVPVSDGRGVTAKTDAILMVRGLYTVKSGN